MGYGSGAHLALLTNVQDAVVASRDSLDIEQGRHMPEGIKQLCLWGGEVELPRIKGLILSAHLPFTILFLGVIL
jgi:hypothetical protein